jgi:hypothetical protein
MYAATNSFLEYLILQITDTLIREGYRAVAIGPHSLDGKLFMGDISQKHAQWPPVWAGSDCNPSS